MLAIYDPWVIGFIAPVVWKESMHIALVRYRKHLGKRHLDVGPGTGYLIRKAEPAEGTEITLLDPNPNVLEVCARRLAALRPVLVEADVMKPLPLQGRFDSAALSFVIHRLPGPLDNEAIAIRNVADVLEPDGVLFGSTVLGTEAGHARAARAFLRAANRQGAFDDLHDTAGGLRDILGRSFRTVEVEVTRSVAHFSATGRARRA